MRKKLVSLENIQFKYEGQTDFALNDVSFDIYEGEWLAIVGHNGSGKSTLAKLLNGLQFAKAGTITVNGNVLIRRNGLGCSTSNWNGFSKSR